MYEGDFADMCAKQILLVLIPSGGSSVRRPVREDPHWRQRIFGPSEVRATSGAT